MKSLLLIGSMLLMAAPSISQKNQEDLGLPELHKIQEITLGPSYSCRSEEEFRQGVVNTALFINKGSRYSSGQVLLFNGACGSPDYLEAGYGGDNSSVIADLGQVRLEDIKTDQAFNLRRIGSPEFFSRFASEARPQPGHTYALVINTAHERGLVLFTITGYVRNKSLDLRYVVKQYELLKVIAQSPGFDWQR